MCRAANSVGDAEQELPASRVLLRGDGGSSCLRSKHSAEWPSKHPLSQGPRLSPPLLVVMDAKVAWLPRPTNKSGCPPCPVSYSSVFPAPSELSKITTFLIKSRSPGHCLSPSWAVLGATWRQTDRSSPPGPQIPLSAFKKRPEKS